MVWRLSGRLESLFHLIFESSNLRPRKDWIELLIETFMRKQLGFKAHTVTNVEEAE